MITNIEEFCRLFYNTTLIPISYYNISTKTVQSYPAIWNDSSILKLALPEFTHISRNPDYIISQSFSYFGYVQAENDYIIIGPVFSTSPSESALRNFMKEWACIPEYKSDIEQSLTSIPTVSFHRFLHILAYLHLCLNDESINVAQHFNLDNTEHLQEFSQRNTEQIFESKENQIYHNTWQFERTLMGYIQDGNSPKIKELLQSATNLTEGVLANNTLRHRKNMLITSIALAMRSAIAGGMDIEQAYQLADIYILEGEHSQSIPHVSNLEYTMLLDFADRVAQNKLPHGMSSEVFDCIQFINQHINEAIQVSDVAAYIGKSPAYISAKFKKDLGFQLSSFIMRCKLEEAKSLLTYSDKSLCEISNYLCFSSQSYFQNVFKKKYGITPKQYRDKSKRF